MQVFYNSPWVPPEWITSHGHVPRGVWFADDLALGPLPLGAGVCAFAGSMLRFAQAQTDSAVVFSTHCDQLRRAFDALDIAARQRCFLFNLPSTWQSAAARHLFAAELERLGRFLVQLGGHAPSAEALARSMEQYALGRKQLLEAAPHSPARPYAEAIARFHWDGTVNLPPPQPANGSTPLTLVGGPLPRAQWQVLDVIERAGGRVSLNATEPGERSLWQAPSRSPNPSAGPPQLESLRTATPEDLAQRCLAHCVDVFQRPNTPLYDWLKPRLAARRVRGILLWHYVGCDLWRAEAQPLREAFGLPVLLIEAAETAGDLPRQAGRIEAFLEALRGPHA
jgi:benzoyl-CoA reductase/2-hydroxyglutaryl-CoA dehydratase subunit BcrC/BadD/HgdB